MKKKDNNIPDPLAPPPEGSKKPRSSKQPSLAASRSKQPRSTKQPSLAASRSKQPRSSPTQEPHLDPASSATVPEASASGTQSKQPQEGRDASGRFAAGHAKTGGIQKGQKQKLSLRIQNSVLNMVANEVESGRFAEGLEDLYHDDPKSYYQVLVSYMKFCAPTLQSQSLEITSGNENKTIDDRLNDLMNSINK